MKHTAPAAPAAMLGRTLRFGLLAGSGVLGGQIAHAILRELPSFEGTDLSGSFGDPGSPPFRLLVVGDSTVTAPGLDDPEAGWPRLVAKQLARRFHVELVCLAEGGARSKDVLQRQVPAALDRRWDLVIVSVGSNDVLRFVPVWRFAERLDGIVDQLQDRARAVILFGVGDIGSIPRLPFPADRLAWGAGHIADWVHRRIATRHGTAKIDQWRLTTEAFNSGVHMFSPDLFHPSALGHRVWADALMPTVDEVVTSLEPHSWP